MKKNISGLFKCFAAAISFAAMGSCALKAQPTLNSKEGINFTVLSLAAAKEKAKTENKPLFVFVHASWCPTCKQMEKEVLIRKELGDAFNGRFLNVAIDIDSPDGHRLNESYPVKGTPTLLFFSPDGNIESKIVGFTTAKDLLATAHQAEISKP